MLKLIEEDADSFSQRAEMYYKKRPELINMVEDFYRAHRSLAERYDQLKLEAGTRIMTTPTLSPLSKSPSQKPSNWPNKSLETSSGCFDSEESEVDESPSQKISNPPNKSSETSPGCFDSEIDESPSQKISNPRNKSLETSSDCFDYEDSEVDDPEQEGTQIDGKMGEAEEISSKDGRESEMLKLREEIERLREQNRIQSAELMERNEEKREAIRQLCLAMNMLKEENISLRKCLKDSRKSSLFEFSKWKGFFPGKLFSGHPKSQTTIVAL